MDKEIQTFGRQEQLFAGNGESTDLALMVDALAQEERSPWDASRIRDALMVEAGTDPATAESIALEVEEDLLKYGRTKVTTSIIREMVNVKLFQRGRARARRCGTTGSGNCSRGRISRRICAPPSLKKRRGGIPPPRSLCFFP